MNEMYGNIKYFHIDFEPINYGMNISELKNTVTEVKNSMYRINRRLDLENGISKLKKSQHRISKLKHGVGKGETQGSA